MSILVVDVGTSSVRAAIVRPDGTVAHLLQRRLPPTSPFPGMVEFDPAALAATVLELAAGVLARAGGGVRAVGISTQRASTVLWDRDTGEPLGPGIGWQDLRTVFDCITLNDESRRAGATPDAQLRLAPNQTATKARWLLGNVDHAGRNVCVGTVDSWVAWTLSGASAHVTDRTNAAITGLLAADASRWDPAVCAAVGVPTELLARVVDSIGVCAEARALDGSPPIAGLIGDQQASLIGQSCVTPAATKITFGTGGMLDACVGPQPPQRAGRHRAGTFPIVAWSEDAACMWGLEGIMLSAGSNVDWLVEDLGLVGEPAQTDALAASVASANGVVYVPALLGLGTPHWDYGARGGLFGVTRGTSRAEVVRAVLEGVAHRGADLIEAAEAHLGRSIDAVRIDGGMSANETFVQALANAAQRPVEVAPLTEATTLGAAYAAGLATGVWGSWREIADAWRPRRVVEPTGVLDRETWAEAVRRSGQWIPDLSALDFEPAEQAAGGTVDSGAPAGPA